MGLSFSASLVQKIRRSYNLKPRYDRLRENGLLTVTEMADALGVSTRTVRIWRDWGMLTAYYYNDKKECLYEYNPDSRPEKWKHRRSKVTPNTTNEV